ncbi:hypothetical protein BLNAU_11866 [Blattamonas nauphoetae]|uniref:Uncharacterized protein n=1 Tax=Blattamonas nauphoetae TaxID=2049346 RepID=A0ABQ9XP09_9EUKA|nr:hypothetical protein BLNAU_23008 [Blattamonas nauphoetae]KAK2953240.1 hypothetical protein BLNAU_11866 [Blattamonas nauphoetae]
MILLQMAKLKSTQLPELNRNAKLLSRWHVVQWRRNIWSVSSNRNKQSITSINTIQESCRSFQSCLSDSKISTQQPTPALISYPSAQAHSNEYELTILTTHAGVEEGTLMFITDEEVNLSTQVRKPIALDLHLFNPIETEIIVFAVK